MINYNKNQLIDECLDKYYATFKHTLDTGDYVPKHFNRKILKYIFKNMKRQFRKVDKEDRVYQRVLKKEIRKKIRNDKKKIKLKTKADKYNIKSKNKSLRNRLLYLAFLQNLLYYWFIIAFLRSRLSFLDCGGKDKL